MQRDFDGTVDPGGMTDEELYDLLMQEFRESQHLQPGWIDLRVRDGFVTLGGTVGTDMEVQVAEKIVDDLVGVDRYRNDMVVSELHRAIAPEAADLAVAADRATEDSMGEPNPQQTDTAEHLVEDLEEQAYGTHDPQAAIRDGAPYIPPDGPFPEGYRSTEDH